MLRDKITDPICTRRAFVAVYLSEVNGDFKKGDACGCDCGSADGADRNFNPVMLLHPVGRAQKSVSARCSRFEYPP